MQVGRPPDVVQPNQVGGAKVLDEAFPPGFRPDLTKVHCPPKKIPGAGLNVPEIVTRLPERQKNEAMGVRWQAEKSPRFVEGARDQSVIHHITRGEIALHAVKTIADPAASFKKTGRSI